MDQITTGVKITVDATDLDIKFLKSVEQLNAGLTKTQRSLNLTYNEQGLLTNALGQCVEGLSASQIKLGEYVDVMGRVHTMQGGFIEGLNKSQIAMGQYTDELGNIYSAAGEMIGQTEKAAKALKDQAEAAEETEKQEKEAGESYTKLGDIAKETNEALKEAGLNTPFGPLLDNIGECCDALVNFSDALEAIENVGAGLAKFTQYATASKNGFTSLNLSILTVVKTLGRLAVAMGPIGWTIAGITTAVTALSVAYNKMTEKPTSDAWSESFQRISDAAYAAGREVKTLKDALEFGVGSKKKNDVQSALDEYSALNATGWTKEEREKVEHLSNGGALSKLFGSIETAAIEFDHLFGSYNDKFSGKDLEDQKAATMDVVNKYLEEIQESQKAEAQKLQEELTTIHAVEATGELNEEQKKILEQKAEDLSKAIKAETLKEIGVTLEKTPTAAETFNERLTKASEMYGAGRLTVEELEGAQTELAKTYAKQVAQEAKTRDEIATAQEQLVEAYNAHKITEQDLSEANKELGAAEQSLIEAERKEIESKLGISLEEPQTAEEKLNEGLELLSEKLKEQAITEDMYNRAKEQLTENYQKSVLEKFPGLAEMIEAGKEPKSAAEKHADTVGNVTNLLETGKIDQSQADTAIAKAYGVLAVLAAVNKDRKVAPSLNILPSDQDVRSRSLVNISKKARQQSSSNR